MFRKKLKWYRYFESKEELDALFLINHSAVYQNMFGEVLFIKEGDEYHAFKNKCPHQNKPLNGCTIHDGHIVCPFHHYHYSLNDGRGHGLYVDKYALKIDESGVFVGKEKISWF